MSAQPPPRGCVLKHSVLFPLNTQGLQPPPRGCVLKHATPEGLVKRYGQPPPRGCVLKLGLACRLQSRDYAAASARLCVETDQKLPVILRIAAAAFG